MNKYLKLDKSNVAKYEELTYPVFRPRLRKIAPDTSTIAIGVESQSEPIGLVFAAYSDTKSRGTVYRAPTRKTYGQILSLFVAPDYRGQGNR